MAERDGRSVVEYAGPDVRTPRSWAVPAGMGWAVGFAALTLGTMVPDLHALPHATDAAFWRGMITHGRDGTLMPAFSNQEGGPLTDAQIESLVTYLSTHFHPATAKTAPEHSPQSS